MKPKVCCLNHICTVIGLIVYNAGKQRDKSYDSVRLMKVTKTPRCFQVIRAFFLTRDTSLIKSKTFLVIIHQLNHLRVATSFTTQFIMLMLCINLHNYLLKWCLLEWCSTLSLGVPKHPIYWFTNMLEGTLRLYEKYHAYNTVYDLSLHVLNLMHPL
jgi:hypothetical protein